MNASAHAVKITILVDNTAAEGLMTEHGLSVWIEVSGRHVLFDTGQGGVLRNNAEKLSIPLHTTDSLVLSHGHYDHTGAVPYVLERAPDTHVYCHPVVNSSRYSIRDGSSRSIGMPGAAKVAIESLSTNKVHWTTQPVEMFPGVGITGPIPRITDYEDTGGPFFIDVDGKLVDTIDDDLALWIHTNLGLVVVVGCCHSGLINTLSYVRRLSGTSRIHAVIGGFHLLAASDKRLDNTVNELSDLGSNIFVPCHCTGERAMDVFQKAFGDRVLLGRAGATYAFGGARACKAGA